MKPEWSTPPKGDFAAYVEKLGAQAARSLAAHGERQEENRTEAAHEAAQHKQQRVERRADAAAEDAFAAPGYQPKKAATNGGGAIDVALARRLFGAFVLVLVVFNVVFSPGTAGLIFSVVLGLVAWVALQALTLAGGSDRAAALRRQIERRLQEAARKK